ncbi:hypothetical protein MMC12_006807 [Toensbergia leucococca]|nr:hypothetical protein [Toensbergia leucococca]
MHKKANNVGLIGLKAHMRAAENARVEAEEATKKRGDDSKIRFYTVAPGVLKTAFTGFIDRGKGKGKTPEDGAEVMVRLVADEEQIYEGGT